MSSRLSKLNKLKELILEDESTALMVTKPENIYYLTGFNGSNGIFILSSNRFFLITDSRYKIQAKNQVDDIEVVIQVTDLLKTLNQIFNKININTIIFEKSITYNFYDKLKRNFKNFRLIPSENLIENHRVIKSKSEIENIKNALSISEKALTNTIKIIKENVREIDICNELEYQVKRLGGEGLAFNTIVSSGKRTALPHSQPTKNRIKKGDFLTIDFGGKYNNYCSDMTRTYVIGKANKKQKKIYSIVLKSQNKAISSIKANITGADADFFSRYIINKENYGAHFSHGLGHGIGLETHEKPKLSPNQSMILKENMVVTIEPGIYIEGFGGVRIEDIVLINKNNCENLTKMPKDLIEI